MNLPFQWRQYIPPTFLFCIILLVYIWTLCPTVYWEDAGELITVSHVLGIAHPPGHPLYTILGHLFTLIPFGSIAWRVNLMSAVFGALAATLVYQVVLQLLKNDVNSLLSKSAAAAAALFAAFGLALWDQAVVAETSTLHAFFFMTLLLLFLKMLRERETDSFPRALYAFSFVYGLSLTNHVAGVFVMPAFALWALLGLRSQILAPRKLALSLLFFCLGLSVYLYLPLRSMQNPVIDWGNPETLSNFWWVITAAQFRHNVLAQPTSSQILDGIVRKLVDIRANFQGIGIAFIVAGIWVCAHRQRQFLLFALSVIAILAAVTINPAFISAYFIPASLLLAVFLGIGAEALARALARVLGQGVSTSGWRPVLTTALCVALVVAPLLSLARHYPLNDRSRYYLAEEYAQKILDSLPQNAIFFTVDLNAIFTIWYLQFCEGKRPDVLVIEPTWLANSSAMSAQLLERHPELLLPESGEQIAVKNTIHDDDLFDKNLLFAILEKNSQVRPVYWGAPPAFTSLQPLGLVYQFISEGADVMNDESVRRNAYFWEEIAEEFRQKPSLMCDRVASLIYPENLRHQAFFYKRMENHAAARWAFELALQINPSYAPAWLGLGELHMQTGKAEDALLCLQQAAILDYRLKPRALCKRGAIYYESGKYHEAAAEFNKAIKYDAAYPDVHNFLGSVHLRTGRIDEAEKEFRMEIRLNPSTPGAYSNLAQILMQQQKLDEAEALLYAGIEVQPQVWQSYYFLARLKALRGEKERAARLLEDAIQLGGPAVRNAARQDEILSDLTTITLFAEKTRF